MMSKILRSAAYAALWMFIGAVSLHSVRGALPLTPSTTYVATTPPVIKAADLNDLQKYLAGLYSAIYSVKALVIDGTGGNGVTGTAGSLQVSRTVTGTTAPTTTVAQGELPKGMVPNCWALINSAGALQRGANINAITQTATGAYRVICNSTPAHFDGVAAIGTLLNQDGVVQISAQDDGTGKLRLNVVTKNLGGSAADLNFQFVAFAE